MRQYTLILLQAGIERICQCRKQKMAVKHHVDVFDSWDGDTLLDEEFRTRDDLFAKTSGPSLGVERWSTSSAADQSQRDSKYLRHPSEETKLSAPKKQLWQELISERHELEGLQEQRVRYENIDMD
jgi:hypothetical protein